MRSWRTPQVTKVVIRPKVQRQRRLKTIWGESTWVGVWEVGEGEWFMDLGMKERGEGGGTTKGEEEVGESESESSDKSEKMWWETEEDFFLEALPVRAELEEFEESAALVGRPSD